MLETPSVDGGPVSAGAIGASRTGSFCENDGTATRAAAVRSGATCVAFVGESSAGKIWQQSSSPPPGACVG